MSSLINNGAVLDIGNIKETATAFEGSMLFPKATFPSAVLISDEPQGEGEWLYIDGAFRDTTPAKAQAAAVQEQVEAAAAVAAAQAAAKKVDLLWKAADAYVSSYISGMAIGLLTVGVLQQKPKALAISAWSSAVWGEYYARKATVTATSDDNLDFSAMGPMPHSVPELQQEIGL